MDQVLVLEGGEGREVGLDLGLPLVQTALQVEDALQGLFFGKANRVLHKQQVHCLQVGHFYAVHSINARKQRVGMFQEVLSVSVGDMQKSLQLVPSHGFDDKA